MPLLRDLLAALRKPATVAPDAAAADVYAASLLDGAPAVAPAPIVGSPEASGWHAVPTIEAEPAPLGEARVEDGVASYASPPLALPDRALRYAVIRLRASTAEGRAEARLSWLSERRGTAPESGSASFSVVADGVDRTHVVDLWQGDGARFWRARPERVRLRLHPLDRAGTARVLALALLPDGWQHAASPVATGVPAAADALETARRRRDARRALRAAARGLAVGNARWLAVTRDPAWTRAWLGRDLDASGVVVERLEMTSEGTRALLRRVAPGRRRGVDIVVQKLVDRERALAALDSVVRHARGDYRLLIVDDAGDPALSDALEAFAAKHERAVVLGGADVDHGGNRDVLLLDGDARVFRGFLAGLRACARVDAATGIACALAGVDAPEKTRDKQLATLVRRASRRLRPELQALAGGCTYVRAEVLADIGRLDAGELCERARAAGWTIRLADDVLVVRAGTRAEAATAIHDELAWHARRSRHAREPAVMMLLSASPFESTPGAAAAAVRALVEGLALPRVVIAYPGEGGVAVAEVLDGDFAHAGLHRFTRRRHVERALARVVELFRVGHVHVHDVAAWPPSAQRVLARAHRPTTLTLHDAPDASDASSTWLGRWIAVADRVVAASPEVRAIATSSYALDPDRVVVWRRDDDVHAWLAAHRDRYAAPSPSAASRRLRRREYHALADSRR